MLNTRYPKIYNQFIWLYSIDKYNIYIDRGISNDEYSYFLIFELKNNLTGRIFFNPKDISFSLFVYPNIIKASSSYTYQVYDEFYSYFEMLSTLIKKNGLVGNYWTI